MKPILRKWFLLAGLVVVLAGCVGGARQVRPQLVPATVVFVPVPAWWFYEDGGWYGRRRRRDHAEGFRVDVSDERKARANINRFRRDWRYGWRGDSPAW